MTTLITGCAGFIGFHVTQTLLKEGKKVIGLDNLNDYYDEELKNARLEQLQEFDNFTFVKASLHDKAELESHLDVLKDATNVIHMAAQAGVRYSLKAPETYVDSNLTGLTNLLELTRHHLKVKHFLFASSSSVYGDSESFPLSTSDLTNKPISFYAATKKSGEVICHSYSHLFGIPISCLRFFTVYGPWGRPDMSPYIFTDKIIKGETIPLFNSGKAERSFTYIDDAASGILKVLAKPSEEKTPYQVLNIGNDHVDKLTDMITYIENAAGRRAVVENLPAQPGDVKKTAANITYEREQFGFDPKTSLEDGIKHFVDWYKSYHGS